MIALFEKQITQLHEQYATFDELRGREGADALTPNERREMEWWKDPVRREAWLMGRLLSKNLIRRAIDADAPPFESIEVLSRNAHGQSVRPEIRVDGELQPWSLSISHTRSAVLAALSLSDSVEVGVDLTVLDDAAAPTLSVWYTPREKLALAYAEPEERAIVWAVKEAVYKAYNRGEGFAPKSIEVVRDDSGRWGCRVAGEDVSDRCTIRHRVIADQIAVVVAYAKDAAETAANINIATKALARAVPGA